jgi:glutamyl-Q tRNA(Asp) synthetase
VPDRARDVASDCISFEDRWVGHVTQNLATEVGDFVLKRADGFWAYQLAVVVDDADQNVTHVVRGSDLLDSTPRQVYLQRLLGFPTPRYLHVPVVTNAGGEKLSKQTGALALDLSRPQAELNDAARFLGLPDSPAKSLDDFWRRAIDAWATRFRAG